MANKATKRKRNSSDSKENQGYKKSGPNLNTSLLRQKSGKQPYQGLTSKGGRIE